jgi:hypothetical protein
MRFIKELFQFIGRGIAYEVKQWFCFHVYEQEEWQGHPHCVKCMKEKLK